MTEAVSGPVAGLAARLRDGGVRVGVGEVLGAHRALAAVDPADPSQARWALQAALCAGRDDLAVFAEAWTATFGAGERAPEGAVPDEAMALALPHAPALGEEDATPPPGDGLDEPEAVPAAYSPVELPGDKDFATYTEAELALAHRLLVRLARRGPLRASRRTVPARRRRPGARPDLRATLRASLRHGGEPIDRRWRAPGTRQRPVVLVVDVSGSMEPYARVLLQYLHACVQARRRVEAFAFGTRLTRITRELAGRDHDRALARAAAAVTDWSGGTRIGASLAQLNREHGRRIGRGSVVVILSDGWDRGEPELLGAELARLRRCAHRVIWLNPLKADPRYEPLARGMAAALPHTDHFLAGNSLASLERLATLLEGVQWATSVTP